MRIAGPAVRRLGFPVLWILALLWLSLQTVGNGVLAILDAHEQMTDSAGRVAARAGRLLQRALGPVGRQLRRLTGPLLRLLRHAVVMINVKLLLRLFRPMSR